jgi:hypothetical protein
MTVGSGELNIYNKGKPEYSHLYKNFISVTGRTMHVRTRENQNIHTSPNVCDIKRAIFQSYIETKNNIPFQKCISNMMPKA